ncbi:Fibronectin type III domain protein [Ignavibacterium album JCM 16511]|uniref:Fibronectin type III domain protein n=1 Tax=Ignavibacterium album (strain DSM 19864 / JCM 16511 / NBRC 101810 / Mat9-16) TaxID=945713 RepID=I0ALG5_IGNAJ|nr:fibronectin type III domain-containing protein [Ignavibacterium album]AFH49822.1 Fibronectin type III domain protein [Ignavibacterium album JCM 16511]
MKTKQSTLSLLFFFSLLTFYFSPELNATIRYVSKTGSSTPPYTSWATAADSIQKCINICEYGDTIYVANGVYKEKIVMIPGLSLIGAGMDSCVIDTRDLPMQNYSVYLDEGSLIENFFIKVSNNSENGYGFYAKDSVKITFNRVTSGVTAIRSMGINLIIKENFISSFQFGIQVSNSSPSIIRNTITNCDYSIYMNTPYLYYEPIIDSNYIDTYGSAISNSFGSKPTVRNNFIILRGRSSVGFSNGYSDTAKVYNNVVIAFDSLGEATGFYNSALPHLSYNNFVYGKVKNGFVVSRYNKFINNSSIGPITGVLFGTPIGMEVHYNNVWNSQISYSGFTPDSTNTTVDPMIVNDDTTQGELDFHLQKFSPLIDAGDPTILDLDGTRSDIGLYGGPFGQRYIYQDLPPKPPVNLTALVDSGRILLRWNRNTEADSSHYNIFRSLNPDFTADSTTLFGSTTDTFFVDKLNQEYERLYYKITCVDRQGNQSNPSEEIAIVFSSINDYPITINDYYLYQNYPNPFNPTTKIGYRLKEDGYVKLYVYNIKGEVVDILVNQYQQGGYYEVEFNVGNSLQTDPQTLIASGIYIYQIMVRGRGDIPVFTDSKKMLFIK